MAQLYKYTHTQSNIYRISPNIKQRAKPVLIPCKHTHTKILSLFKHAETLKYNNFKFRYSLSVQIKMLRPFINPSIGSKSLILSWEMSLLLVIVSNKGNLIIANQIIHEAPRPFLGKFIIANQCTQIAPRPFLGKLIFTPCCIQEAPRPFLGELIIAYQYIQKCTALS